MLQLRGHRSLVHGLSFSSDGTILASIGGQGKSISLWDLTRNNKKRFLSGHGHPVLEVRCVPNKPYLLSIAASSEFFMWNLEESTSQSLGFTGQNRFPTRFFDISADGSKFLHLQWHIRKFGCVESKLSIDGGSVSLGEWKEVCSVSRTLGVVGFTSSPTHLAIGMRGTGSKTSNAFVWPISGGDHPHDLMVRGSMHDLSLLDDKVIAIASGNEIYLRNIASGELHAVLRGHKRMVTKVVGVNSGSNLISCSTDGIVRIWDVAAGKEVRALDWEIGPLRSLALSVDETRAAVGGASGHIVMWDVDL